MSRNESLSCSPTRDDALPLITWPGGSQINEEALWGRRRELSFSQPRHETHPRGESQDYDLTTPHRVAPIITQRWQLTVSAHSNAKKENSGMRQVPESNQTALSEKQLGLPSSDQREPTYQRKGKSD